MVAKHKDSIQYFRDGFSFVNRNVYLILIGLGMYGILDSIDLLQENASPGPLLLLSLTLEACSIGYFTALPVFFERIRKQQSVAIRMVLSTTMRITIRLILQALPFFFLLLVILFLLVLIMSLTGDSDFMQYLPDNATGWFLMMLPLLILSSLFVFEPMYFSLERMTLFDSLKRSAIFSVHHLQFTGIIALIYVGQSLILNINNLQLTRGGTNWSTILLTAITTYVSYGIMASAWLYYSDNT